jgi:hypothetical protein
MTFKPNRKFWRKYRSLFKKNPFEANLFLLLCEIADNKGQVETDPDELALLMAIRFEDSWERQI